MSRYAALSVLQLTLMLILATGVASGGVQVLFLAAVLPLFFAWGHVQADLSLNSDLDVVARTRWRTLIWCVPGSVALYWLLHVRPHRAPS